MVNDVRSERVLLMSESKALPCEHWHNVFWKNRSPLGTLFLTGVHCDLIEKSAGM